MTNFAQRSMEILSPSLRIEREQREQAERDAKNQRLNELRFVMASPLSRRFIARLLADGRLMGSTYHSDPRTTERAEGVRDFVTRLAGELASLDAEDFSRLLLESNANNASK